MTVSCLSSKQALPTEYGQCKLLYRRARHGMSSDPPSRSAKKGPEERTSGNFRTAKLLGFGMIVDSCRVSYRVQRRESTGKLRRHRALSLEARHATTSSGVLHPSLKLPPRGKP